MSSPLPREHPPVEAIQFDHELCANLHNRIFQIGWMASAPGRTLESCPSQTWWEYYSPPTEFTARLNDGLVQFLKRACFHPEAPEFFYLISALTNSKWILDYPSFEYRDTDRYVLLHPATGFKMGDEVGLVFDQHTCKATFIEDSDDSGPILDNGYGWKPLEDIYNAYLEMIEEEKVEVSSPEGTWTRKSNCDTFGPWRFHEFTNADVQKSVLAFKRLLDAIEMRLPLPQTTSPGSLRPQGTLSLPWADPSTLDAANIQPGTFARAFCEETAKWERRLSFRYVAPGIRIATVKELSAQPHHESYSKKHWYATGMMRDMPILLFCADDPAPPLNNANPERDTWLDCDGQPIRAGLYTNGNNGHNRSFQNGCRLILPFKFSSNG
jgi:hypothetical protein